MKKTLIIILSIVLLSGCANNNKTGDKPITKEEKDSIETNLWGPIDIKSWDKTPSINGRVATPNDVAHGVAVFSVENGGSEHNAYKTQLPKLAYLIDSATKKEELVIVIQIEYTSEGIITGYRNLDGGNGACFLHEVKFLDEQMIKQIVGHQTS